MMHLPASVRVYLCLTPCDMRKSFDSLHALVRDHLDLDVLGGHLFVFTSRRRDRVKILYWDRDGLAVWSKRLEEGTYAVRFDDGARERQREITAQELGALLSGIDLNTAKRRKRYRCAGS
jgi:transposase